MAEFDNLDDVTQKFYSTIVLYDKKAAMVKGTDKTPDGFTLHLAYPNTRVLKVVPLSDPALNYKNFQLGYVNGGTYAYWFYRKPQKQWSQGLKSNQMGYITSKLPGHDGGYENPFGFSKPYIQMLENIYPSVEDVKKALTDGNMQAMAWHRDFALSYDAIHEDCILEYRGQKIGVSISPDMSKFKILPHARHLQEALEEARYNVHP